ncbi:MAG: septum formation protein Maf [Gammaproteobacteria bacterium]|nr:septum formation protein Maf [Gammaproteobacteria bacterium]NNF59767.1 septum formation protein Maf [Gammaproteobacteria bacterium]NNM20961.1 septum formation protein Maf [Gammaproteobacteria bacterium]
MNHPDGPALVLASASKYRRMLLNRLALRFDSIAPNIDESRHGGETPEHLATRLAREKARAVAAAHTGTVVIGSDQVATRGDNILGKPGDFETARTQLLESSDQEVTFYTAVSVMDTGRGINEHHTDCTRVDFRSLNAEEIQRYLEAERPFDCAGAFKAEGLGISLFWRIQTVDPTAIMGLPLIWLASALRRAGYQVP